VGDAGILIHPLKAAHTQNGAVKLSGAFGVFFSGRLEAHFYDEHGGSLATLPMMNVSPAEAVTLDKEVSAGKAARVSLHLVDESGLDRGSLGEVRVEDVRGEDVRGERQ
jgi:hypothetical protein